jgi:hypothetical protein
MPSFRSRETGIWRYASWFFLGGFMVFNEHSLAVIQPAFKGMVGDVIERGKRIVGVLNYLKDTVMIEHGQPDNAGIAGFIGFWRGGFHGKSDLRKSSSFLADDLNCRLFRP